MQFCRILKELRTVNGLTQSQLASKANLATSCIAMLETNKREPNANTLISLSRALEVSTDYLLGLEDDFGNKKVAAYPLPIADQQYTDEEKLIIEEYRKLPKTSKELVLRMVGITEKKNV